MPLKFVTANDNVFQLLGTSSPRPSHLYSFKISFKNPLFSHHKVKEDYNIVMGRRPSGRSSRYIVFVLPLFRQPYL